MSREGSGALSWPCRAVWPRAAWCSPGPGEVVAWCPCPPPVPWQAVLAPRCPPGCRTGWLLLPKLVLVLQPNPSPYGSSGGQDDVPLAAALGSAPAGFVGCHTCCSPMWGRRETLWSLSATRMVFPENKFLDLTGMGGSESHHASSEFNIMFCKNMRLMSVTISPILPSPNYLSAFFSLTKDESKRPKYKELLVSVKRGFQCRSHSGAGSQSEITPCLLGPSGPGVQLCGGRRSPPPCHCLWWSWRWPRSLVPVHKYRTSVRRAEKRETCKSTALE